MDKKSRRKFSAEFKTKVVLEAIKERITVEEISKKYEIHPNQVSKWKKEFLSKASSVFSSEVNVSGDKKNYESILNKLYAEIGQQKVENDWLKKKLQ